MGKLMFIDCSMGAAGDMLTSALLELFPDADKKVLELNSLGIPDVRFVREKSVKCGITGTHMRVLVHGEEEEVEDHDHSHGHDDHEHDHPHEHDHHHEHDHEHEHEHSHEHEHEHEHSHEHEHHHGHDHHHHSHTSLHDIEHIVRDHLNIPDVVKQNILKVYNMIAEAESAAHGVPVTEIHFHEVGTMDAVADITAVCYLMNELRPDRVIVSPVHVGSGQVKCAHGILPVPAPATAYILKGAPIYGGSIKGELCTPTGAALLKTFATEFASIPVMNVSAIGYGMGKKDFEAANCVRIMYGEDADSGKDKIYELSCNVDDMTGEEIGYAMEKLFKAGAKDVFTVAVGMKKNRPGILIKVICAESEKDEIVRTIFKYTTTIGIRESEMYRYILDRTTYTLDTAMGKVRSKKSHGYGVDREKYEYDDLAAIAEKNQISISEVRNRISKE